jgi:hypothetical protein
VRLFHFSEDPAIERFTPHVPATNPDHLARVWAIDEQHQSAYWFPRDCPRVAVWASTEVERFQKEFATVALRLHAIEARWRSAISTAIVYRYELAAALFEPWPEADGQWVSAAMVEPLVIEPLGDLAGLHRDAGIELRTVESLWPLRNHVAASDWPFSIIRMMYADPPPS